ncbi:MULTISPECIES: phosphonate ABC transporter substrate-binding protein [Pseudorhizobium]|jgi:phosphonate transport system substrate-binding protein|uniref:Phosphonate ABC transporter substrate-binding protein n=1 Tax=Pseudorhizobium pelagicum TaxID=1509405 RepID=A0A922P1U2_9HYPH|nr:MULTISPECIES: phosphonate ABC transporter substrate-binding protein [Pseudorhizobium]MBA4786162.1 phosphonate ABC transporter substrate-binding protein [Hyphomicrobiales bacterium]MBU1313637.1 phosphonate ABC transporter substrate-binding protein [Alphaproteobacteria bacterium]KEQ04314.1 phosphonate ABC transporter substrate-binding protein [Pseudorhizobium pelagicum]KEQ07320.1 phosphonate ABC transporter substrate-binding protein [Pseudorhizobium pelagicum]MBU1550228.1 phosphonate ABC tran|tara:strand:+ start:656 stop:1564 length:909 start_codon:yes stop_codon:yes gene_type:complete
MLKKTMLATVALVALAGNVMAQDLKEFRIGILGGENEADRLRNFQCMTEKLPAVLGVEKVSLFPAADYDGVVQGLLGGTLDYAELGASAYAKVYLEDANAVQPILTTVQTDGSMGYHSIMVARKDSGMTKVEDIKGKKLGYADPDSTSGYLIPVVTLPEALGGATVEEFVAETGFGGGHENLVLEVVKGTFDAGTTWGSGVGEFKDGYSSGNLRKMVDKGILNMDDLVELWKSPLIPNGPVVVRSSMSEDMKTKFKEFMVGLPKSDPACFSAVQGGDFTGFAEVDVDFYKPIIDARKATIGG